MKYVKSVSTYDLPIATAKHERLFFCFDSIKKKKKLNELHTNFFHEIIYNLN